MRLWPLLVLVLGCSAAPTDSLAPTRTDAEIRTDEADAGIRTDATSAEPDSGTIPTDAGTPPRDPDAGTAAADSGAAPPDAGTTPRIHFQPCGTFGVGTITRAVPSPDGRLVALATAAGHVVLVSSVDGSIVQRFVSHAGRVIDVAFSPDGNQLYSWGDDRTLRAWSLGGAMVWAAPKARGPVEVRLAVDGRVVAVGGPPADLFDARSGGVIRSLDHPGVGQRIGYDPGLVAIQPGGQRVAVAQGETVYLYDASGARLALELTGDLGVVESGAYSPEIQSLAFTPDGRHLLVAVRRAYFSTSGLRYPVARLYDVESGAIVTTLTGDSPYGVSAAISPDGRSVAVAAGHAVDQWTVFGPDGGFLGESMTVVRLGSSASEVRYDALGRVVARQDGTRVHLHTPGQSAADLTLRANTPAQGPLSMVDDNTLLITTGGGNLELWSIGGPRYLRTIAEGVRAAAITRDGRRIAIARAEGVDVFDLAAPASVPPVRASTIANARALAFDPAGDLLAIAADRDGRSSQPSILSVSRIGGPALSYAAAAGPVDQIRATGAGWLTSPPTRDRYRGPHAYELWRLAPPLVRITALEQEGTGVDSADVSAAGTTLLAAGWVTPMRALFVPTRMELPLPAEVRATRVRYSPSGYVLARGDAQGRVMVGPPDAPTEGLRLFAPGGDAPFGEIVRLDFSPGGRMLALATVHGDTRVFCGSEP